MKKDPYGVFEIVLPAKDGKPAIAHNSKIKVSGSGRLLNLPPLTPPDLYDYTFRRTN